MNDNLHQVTIESIDIEGNGVAKIDGMAIFVNGALPGEIVKIQIIKSKSNFAKAKLIEIITPSINRVTPQCPNFGICGGCSLQHMNESTQLHSKQQALLDNLNHIGRTTPIKVLPPISDSFWGYRNRARLSARYVIKKQSALVGFRERASSYVADITQCEILPLEISNLIPKLRELLAKLSIFDKIPQIEVAIGDNLNILIFRIMDGLNEADQLLIKQFVDNNKNLSKPLQIWLQPKGPDSCYPFYPQDLDQLHYKLPQFNITMPFYPTEFTQVNPIINQKMVALAMELLNPQANELIYDFFCGIGNFTLPIARSSKQVIGFEGSNSLVNRATSNAKFNQLENIASFQEVNLFTINSEWLSNLATANKWLIDPPRDGAVDLIKAITPQTAPKEIVYVSCNPGTLARDSAILTQVHGYTLVSAGIINMFPHTSHVESIAHFKLNYNG